MTMSNIETENTELKRQLSKLRNFTKFLCDEVWCMMFEMDLFELPNYEDLVDTLERGRDGDFNG